MSISTIGARSQLSVQFLTSLRSQLEDLQRQLGSGKKSADYAGLGLDRGLAVTLRTQLGALSAFDDTITQVETRLEVAQSALTRVSAIASEVRSAARNAVFNPGGTGQTADQTAAVTRLDELFALLNSRAGDRYMFSGRATDRPATALPGEILDGDGPRAGFRQVLAERWQADLGANGLGRLQTARAGATVSVAQEIGAAAPFGFKVAGISATVTGAAVAGPAGTPPSASIDFGAATPAAGQTVTLQLLLPDGTRETLTLTATASPTPGASEFAIGSSNAATADNMRNALNGALAAMAQTSLRAASGMAAAQDFFDVGDGRPPQRVAGPPFASASALVDGTGANTVTWYSGEGGSDSARATAVARIDPALSIAYGIRANEEGLRSVVQAVAVFACATFSQTDPNATAAYAEMQERVGAVLSGQPDRQRVLDIAAELGGAQATLGAARERHRQTENSLADLLQSIEGVRLEEVGAQILALQTNLQASLQTTAMLYQTTLLDYF